jgi:hypothetical protein
LIRIGYRPAQIPAFSSADTFWPDVVLRLESGIVQDGIEMLLAAVVDEFPGNTQATVLLGEFRLGATAGRNEITVLGLFSDPGRRSKIRIDRESRLLTEIADGGGIRVTLRHAVRVSDLSRALLRDRPRVLHFGGHGWPGGKLVLENDAGGAVLVGADKLAKVIAATMAAPLDAVVLNSCYTAADAESFRGATAAVAGSVNAIGDGCALAFVRGFYTGIALGQPVPKAFATGSAEMGLRDCDLTGLHLVTFDDDAPAAR